MAGHLFLSWGYRMLFFIPAILCAIGSFLVTRGLDGELTACWYLFGLLGVAYWIFLLISRRRLLFPKRIGIFLVCFVSAVIGYSIHPELEGMAGILYFLIPTMLVTIFVIGEILSFLQLLWRRRNRVN